MLYLKVAKEVNGRVVWTSANMLEFLKDAWALFYAFYADWKCFI